MPRPPIRRTPPTPSAVCGPAFRTEEARAEGFTDWSLRALRMVKPTTGVRALEPIADPIALAAAFHLAVPDDAVFSHTTAARLWGLPLPPRLARHPQVHVMRGTGRSQLERRGCVSHRGLERRVTTSLGGLPVVSIIDTWCDLIEAFHRELTLADAVMIADAVVERLQPTRLRAELHPVAAPMTDDWWHDPAVQGCFAVRERLRERRRFRGRSRALEAVELIRPRVWSPAESHTRVVAVTAGIPEPELNASIHYPDGGGFIGYGDVVWGRRKPSRTRLIGEYQGREVHGEGEPSRAEDNDRCMWMRDAGWTVLELYSRDVYTAAGRARLIRRLHRYLA